jgi:hypothetical protein
MAHTIPLVIFFGCRARGRKFLTSIMQDLRSMVGGHYRKRNKAGEFFCLVVLVFPFRMAGGAVIMSIKFDHSCSMYPLLVPYAGLSLSLCISPLCFLDTSNFAQAFLPQIKACHNRSIPRPVPAAHCLSPTRSLSKSI